MVKKKKKICFRCDNGKGHVMNKVACRAWACPNCEFVVGTQKTRGIIVK